MNNDAKSVSAWRVMFLALLMLLGTTILYQPVHARSFLPLREHAVWVFADAASASNPISNATARQSLINHSAASKVSTLYLGVYRSTQTHPTNAAGRLMYEEADIADLISKAHVSGIRVYAAYGAPDWPSFGCAPNGFPLQRLSEVNAYNAAHTGARFDGVILDVEPLPALPATSLSESNFVALLAQYQCFQQQLVLDGGGLGFAVAIRWAWKDLVTFNGVRREVYKHVIDTVEYGNHVVVMGYRDYAGTVASVSDGIMATDQDQIAYARTLGKTEMILAGLETSNPASVGILDRETFYEEGQSLMNGVAQVVLNQFGYFSGLGGFAIHDYASSYLSGRSSKWPPFNPNFPQYVNTVQELATPPGAPVTVTPSGMINGAHVTVTFPSIASTGGAIGNTYVAPLDAAGVPPMPANYLLVNALAFDISTSAVFSGAVRLCFSPMDVPAADFPSLRVLHYTSNTVVDATILSGIYGPNASTRTICAQVTSFSPFVIAKCTPRTGKLKEKGFVDRDDEKCHKPDKR